MQRGLTVALPLLIALLAGCAGPGSRPAELPNWLDRSARLQQLNQWTATGKLALRTSERAESASILWTQQGPNTRLQLSGPMGLNATTIHSDGRKMELRQGDTVRSWDISTPEAIARNTGWDLPLHALPYWLKGLPWPATDIQAMELDPAGAVLRQLKQDDWDVRFEHYDKFDNYTLPTHLRIQRGATSARMIIRDWRTSPG